MYRSEIRYGSPGNHLETLICIPWTESHLDAGSLLYLAWDVDSPTQSSDETETNMAAMATILKKLFFLLLLNWNF